MRILLFKIEFYTKRFVRAFCFLVEDSKESKAPPKNSTLLTYFLKNRGKRPLLSRTHFVADNALKKDADALRKTNF